MQLHIYPLAFAVKMDVIASMMKQAGKITRPSAPIERAWVALARAQRTILMEIEKDLKAAGLPALSQYDVLIELVKADEGRLRPFEIERRILLAQYNLSRLLDRMEKEGLIRRETFAEDGRGQWVAITPAGRALQARMWDVYGGAIQRHMGAKLDDADAAR